jgi:hypothetical protein
LRQFLCALERHDVAAIESLLANGAWTMTDGVGEFRAALMITLKSSVDADDAVNRVGRRNIPDDFPWSCSSRHSWNIRTGETIRGECVARGARSDAST